MYFQGPGKFKRCTMFPIDSPDILEATLSYNGKQYNLWENSFTVTKENFKDALYIYHRYSYIDDDESIMMGRWWANENEIPFDRFRTMESNRFIYTMDDYEEDSTAGELKTTTATITIAFSEDALTKLREFV